MPSDSSTWARIRCSTEVSQSNIAISFSFHKSIDKQSLVQSLLQSPLALVNCQPVQDTRGLQALRLGPTCVLSPTTSWLTSTVIQTSAGLFFTPPALPMHSTSTIGSSWFSTSCLGTTVTSSACKRLTRRCLRVTWSLFFPLPTFLASLPRKVVKCQRV